MKKSLFEYTFLFNVSGDAIICGKCEEIRSTDDVALGMTGADLPTCSATLTEEECPANATSCVTLLTNIFLTPAAEPSKKQTQKANTELVNASTLMVDFISYTEL